MFRTFANIFRVPDLRKKVLMTLFMVAIFRLGTYVPLPGVDTSAVTQVVEKFREGGQMPLFRRLPKRGFNNKRFATRYAIVNVDALNVFQDGDEVDPAGLLRAGLVSSLLDGVKILGNGELQRRLTVKAQRFSKAAAEKIQAAGGTLITL